MTRWQDRVNGLLFEGESVVERVPVGEGAVVVTSHRVLAFAPHTDGANFVAVDRPNVEGAARRTRGEPRFLQWAVQAVVVGVVLLVAGQVVSLDALVGGVNLTDSPAQLGLGGLLATMQAMLDLLAMLDEILTLVGALVSLLGAALLGGYLWSREEVIVLEVAGAEDVELPAPAEEGVASQIDHAIRPDRPTGPGSKTGTGGPVGRDPLP